MIFLYVIYVIILLTKRRIGFPVRLFLLKKGGKDMKERMIKACTTCGGNCLGCFYTSSCDYYNHKGPTRATVLKPAPVKLILCKNRHDTPVGVTGCVFPSEINPLQVDEMERYAELILEGIDELELYVTGLSVALVAVINVCHKYGIKLTLMHYNRDTGNYYAQPVI